MSEGTRGLKRKIKTAHSIKSIIRTMKVLAAVAMVSCEKAVKALEHYHRTVETGLVACFSEAPELFHAVAVTKTTVKRMGILIVGSDQGMVGTFNDQIVECAYRSLKDVAAEKVVWCVGERAFARLDEDKSLLLKPLFHSPTSIPHVLPLVSDLLDSIEKERHTKGLDRLLVFFNEPKSKTTYSPTSVQVLPLDSGWLQGFSQKKWPTKTLPEAIDGVDEAFPALIREHLFTALYKACAVSVAAENACRLAAMQVAEKHVEELLEDLQRDFNIERQNTIDAELFDVVAGFEAMTSVHGKG